MTPLSQGVLHVRDALDDAIRRAYCEIIDNGWDGAALVGSNDSTHLRRLTKLQTVAWETVKAAVETETLEVQRLKDAADSLLFEVDVSRRNPHAPRSAYLYLAARNLRAALNGDDPAIVEEIAQDPLERQRDEEMQRAHPDAPMCGRLLVGRGSDVADPVCVLPIGHAGLCAAEREGR